MPAHGVINPGAGAEGEAEFPNVCAHCLGVAGVACFAEDGDPGVDPGFCAKIPQCAEPLGSGLRLTNVDHVAYIRQNLPVVSHKRHPAQPRPSLGPIRREWRFTAVSPRARQRGRGQQT